MNEFIKSKAFMEIVKYGICGCITTGINLVLFYVFSEMGIYYLLANMIAYYIAVVINYFLNYYFVFKNNSEKVKTIIYKLWEFCKLRTVSLLVDSGLFFVLVSVMGFHKYISRICLSAIIILINFVWSKSKIFIMSDKDANTEE